MRDTAEAASKEFLAIVRSQVPRERAWTELPQLEWRLCGGPKSIDKILEER
jgi:hypothetical protein